jgi:hypothetical protein
LNKEFEHVISVDESILPETIQGVRLVRKRSPPNSTAESATATNPTTATTSTPAAIATKSIQANARNDSSLLPSTSATTRKKIITIAFDLSKQCNLSIRFDLRIRFDHIRQESNKAKKSFREFNSVLGAKIKEKR